MEQLLYNGIMDLFASVFCHSYGYGLTEDEIIFLEKIINSLEDLEIQKRRKGVIKKIEKLFDRWTSDPCPDIRKYIWKLDKILAYLE